MNILIIILWFVLSAMAFSPYVEQIANLKVEEKIICILIFILGGPFFVISELLSDMLNLFIGDDDNDIKKH